MRRRFGDGLPAVTGPRGVLKEFPNAPPRAGLRGSPFIHHKLTAGHTTWYAHSSSDT